MNTGPSESAQNVNYPEQAGLRPIVSGKVRDIYDTGEGRLLMVASDRISAFDVVLSESIPDKGRVLTALTTYWLGELANVAPNHLISTDPRDFPSALASLPDIAGRSMLVARAEMLPIECIVRGYLAGSAFKEYAETGTIHGTKVPAGLTKGSRLPEPVFTPSTKATAGHDINISFTQAAKIVGRSTAERAREISLEAYRKAEIRAGEEGLLVADTKFELGIIDGELAICDEVLTPDSSRFWLAAGWSAGTEPVPFDKQPVRDFLEATGWDKRPPAPHLPDNVVEETARRYRIAYEMLSGQKLSDWRNELR
jgi:phosphoribosylaminoimidazole-succinocarboxamide synthase